MFTLGKTARNKSKPKISDSKFSDDFVQNLNFGCFYRNFGQLKNYIFPV